MKFTKAQGVELKELTDKNTKLGHELELVLCISIQCDHDCCFVGRAEENPIRNAFGMLGTRQGADARDFWMETPKDRNKKHPFREKCDRQDDKMRSTTCNTARLPIGQ